MLKSSPILATFSELLIFTFLIGKTRILVVIIGIFSYYHCYIDIFKLIGIFSLLQCLFEFDSVLFVESLYIF